jgi:hypothetical protein
MVTMVLLVPTGLVAALRAAGALLIIWPVNHPSSIK